MLVISKNQKYFLLISKKVFNFALAKAKHMAG